MKSSTNKKDIFSIEILIISLIILSTIFTEIMTFNPNKNDDLFSFAVGLTLYFFFYLNSQKIIDNNQYGRFILGGLILVIISFLKQKITGTNYISLYISGIPLLYMIFLKVTIQLLYRQNDTLKLNEKPIIIYSSKIGIAYYKGSRNGRKPTLKDKVFSILMSIGFMFYATFQLILINRHLLARK